MESQTVQALEQLIDHASTRGAFTSSTAAVTVDFNQRSTGESTFSLLKALRVALIDLFRSGFTGVACFVLMLQEECDCVECER